MKLQQVPMLRVALPLTPTARQRNGSFKLVRRSSIDAPDVGRAVRRAIDMKFAVEQIYALNQRRAPACFTSEPLKIQ